ncbi:MAG: AmmeMemoRadiSam system protein B [Thermodesulfovibrionales bacterium]|nr:AmmeMemoRadiSam system protein B [Thermodesulfovibrionales bacterium]
MKRSAAVAGQFYHSNPSRLKSQVEQYIYRDIPKEKVIGMISPHAGLIYSGAVAGALYSSIIFPETFILIGPNHTGYGKTVAVMSKGFWEMPLRVFNIDEELSKAILQKTPYAEDDSMAHRYEHSLEVQLPFIAYFSETTKIVPITIMKATLKECQEIGKAIGLAIKESGKEIVIVASTDMSHYISDSLARKLDNLALTKILNLDPAGLYSTVKENSISMCGYIPTTVMLYASLELGAKDARLVKYATSAEVSGDYDHVVGYAGVIIK